MKRTPEPGTRRRLLACAAAVGLARAWPSAQAQSPPAALPPAALPESVKAAYLFKFIGYVDWPAGAFAAPDSPVTIGVAGGDPVLAELQRVLPGRTVQGRAVQARRLEPSDAVEGLQVAYLGPALDLTRSAWPGRLREHPVLMVTDDPEGLRYGGMLNFVLVHGRLRFEASLPSADRAGLKLSSRLLSVAERVVTTP